MSMVEATARQADMADGDLDQAQRETGWTATRARVALALFNAGASAAEVAAAIGGVSRNAVIGKIHRSGLSEANRKRSRAAGQARARRREGTAETAGSRRSVKLPKEALPPPDVIDQQIPIEQRRTLAQLDSACCHWPVGDPQGPDFFFCGAAKANDEGIPYCPSHMVRSQQREYRPRKPAGAAFVNTGPSAPWHAR
ncbi:MULTISPECIES: GcrA family cell cycle regulator [unclassified Bradyrhizobium]|uniref:GcrA family cell cycle regulator n=1 Tax=unclassified Bradyrhizobium TaxID=2631580 RepID=UPI00211F3A64|nr:MULTISPECIES: GcrA family cell cycle regulator [unclassified Bradyrhizobium]MDD1534594.1 GcrA cell cycle regulator [Bradyrhizobium sp. WBOS8]MDD1581458.1 GcrA cell cycle regulator [Bradyrhizobium sp. WBOS4]UUO49744.1 GcrA cell cycle regulator [Bradyrhizobium sp. WBOS04]UUO58510.1 GcrA cell cycle regulator [Bradyrhizobium sp. WBOS08]